MARISYANKNAVPNHLQNLFDDMSTYGPFGSLVGAMAHRTPIFEHVFGSTIPGLVTRWFGPWVSSMHVLPFD